MFVKRKLVIKAVCVSFLSRLKPVFQRELGCKLALKDCFLQQRNAPSGGPLKESAVPALDAIFYLQLVSDQPALSDVSVSW